MYTITSTDGTRIAYDRAGEGPAVVIVGAGPTDHWANADVAQALAAEHFTVINYDRRRRGESGDTTPYAVEREFEDLAALIDAAGGSAHVYGTSGGGILSLLAASHGVPFESLAVWETPFITDDTRPPVPADYKDQLEALLAEGRRGEMLELFFAKTSLVPAEFVAGMKQTPFWPSMEAVAPALIYDATIVGDFSLPTERLAAVKVPTLVLDGGTTPWLSNTAEKLAATLPNSQRRTLAGQPHNVDSAAIAPALAEFFTAAP